jgi:hypothetical protein
MPAPFFYTVFPLMERTGKNKQFILSMRKRIEGISTGCPTLFSRYDEKVFTIPRLPVCIVTDGLYPLAADRQNKNRSPHPS